MTGKDRNRPEQTVGAAQSATAPNICKGKLKPTGSDRNGQEQTGTDRNRQEQTGTDRRSSPVSHRPMSARGNWDRQERTGTDRLSSPVSHSSKCLRGYCARQEVTGSNRNRQDRTGTDRNRQEEQPSQPQPHACKGKVGHGQFPT